MGHYVAIRPIRIGLEDRQPGSFVPEAADWLTLSGLLGCRDLIEVPDGWQAPTTAAAEEAAAAALIAGGMTHPDVELLLGTFRTIRAVAAPAAKVKAPAKTVKAKVDKTAADDPGAAGDVDHTQAGAKAQDGTENAQGALQGSDDQKENAAGDPPIAPDKPEDVKAPADTPDQGAPIDPPAAKVKAPAKTAKAAPKAKGGKKAGSGQA